MQLWPERPTFRGVHTLTLRMYFLCRVLNKSKLHTKQMSEKTTWSVATAFAVIFGVAAAVLAVVTALYAVGKIDGAKTCARAASAEEKRAVAAASPLNTAATATENINAQTAAAAAAAAANKPAGGATTLQGASQAARVSHIQTALQAVRGSHAQQMQHTANALASGGTAAAAQLAATHGAAVDGSGKLAPLLVTPTGDTMAHMSQTSIRNTGSLDTAFHDSTDHMSKFDPQGADTLNKALALTGTPSSFHYDDAAAAAYKRTQMVQSMMLAGKVDPTAEEVLAAASPFTATAAKIKQAVLAQGSIDRETVIATPLRNLYQNPLWRQATPFPTLSPIPQDNMPAGLQFAYQSMACSNSGAPVTVEPY